jgi:hypothetical protein
MIYFGRDSSSTEISRIRKSGGGLKNLEVAEGRVAWVGPDNNLYFFRSSPFDQVAKYSETNDSISDFGSCINFHNAISNMSCWVLTFSNRVIICSAQNEVYEAYPIPGLIQSREPSYEKYQALGLKSIKLVDGSQNYYYIAGNNTSSNPVLLKINTSNDVSSTILSEYDLYAMTVNSFDTIIFNALRMSDGAKVIGEISASGQVRILDSTLNTEVVVLERIK